MLQKEMDKNTQLGIHGASRRDLRNFTLRGAWLAAAKILAL